MHGTSVIGGGDGMKPLLPSCVPGLGGWGGRTTQSTVCVYVCVCVRVQSGGGHCHCK